MKTGDIFEAVALLLAIIVLILDLFYWRGG